MKAGTRVRYDWNRYGNPGPARRLSASAWVMTAVVTSMWTVSPWLVRVAPAFTVILPLWTLAVVLQRVQLRKAYGVRRERRIIPPPPPLAELVAREVEAIRQAKWDAVTGQAFRARPPDPERLAAARAAFPAAPRYAEAVAALHAGSQTMQDMQAGLPLLASAMGGCAHRNAVPVDLLVTGERVAWVCPDCPAELPAGWR